MPPPDRDCAGPSRLALWGYRWGVLEAYNNVTGSRPTFLSGPAHNMVTNRAGVGEVVTSRTWCTLPRASSEYKDYPILKTTHGEDTDACRPPRAV